MRKNKNLLVILLSILFTQLSFAQISDVPEVNSLYNLGNQYHNEKLFDLAIESYTKAINKSPNTPELYTRRASSYYQKDLYNAAIQDLLKSIDLGLETAKSYLLLGYSYYMKFLNGLNNVGDAKSSKKFIEKSFTIDPTLRDETTLKILDELNQEITKLEIKTNSTPDVYKVKNYKEVDNIKNLYEIYYNQEFVCYVELPKELAWFVVINQNPNSYEAGSSDWFKNSRLINRWNQQNSNVISREIFLENLGLFINEAKKVGNILILDTQEDNSEDWGLTNSKFKYGIDLNKMNQLKQSSFWKPDESKKYNYLPFRLLDISIIGGKKNNNINLSLSSFVPIKDKTFLIKYDNEEIGYFDFNTELNLDIIEFTLFYQSPEDIIKNSRKNVISLDKTKEMSLIKYEEFLKTLGAYLTYYNLQNYRFIITADDGSRNFTINNNFLFGKSIVGMQELEEIETYYQKELIDIQGWINHPYLR